MKFEFNFKSTKDLVILITGVIAALSALAGFWKFQKDFSYRMFYETKVIETIKRHVEEGSLR